MDSCLGRTYKLIHKYNILAASTVLLLLCRFLIYCVVLARYLSTHNKSKVVEINEYKGGIVPKEALCRP
jgi:hypothetical protein